MAEGFFDGAANDGDTRLFVGVVALHVGQCLLSADVSHATSGHDALFDSGTCGTECVVAAVFLLLLFGLTGCTDLEHAHAAREFAETFLEFLLVVVRSRVFDLVFDLLHALGNVFFLTGTVHNGGIVLRHGDFFSGAEHVERSLLKFESLVLTDHHAAGEHGDVLEHGLATVAESGRLHGTNLQLRAQAVHHEGGQCFAVHIFGDHQEGASALHGGFEDGEEVFEVGNLLVVDQDVGVLHLAVHLFGVGHEVSRKITAVELHTLDGFEHRVASLGIFDGDHAIGRDSAHAVGDEFTDFGVVVGRDGGHLFDFVVVVAHLFGLRLDVCHHGAHGLVDTAFEVEGVGAGSHVFHAFGEDGLREHGGRRRTVARIVARLGGHALDELCAGVLEGVFEFDLLGHAHTVLGDAGRTKLLIDHHVAAFRSERDFNGVGQGVGTLAQEFASIYVVLNIFCHDLLLIKKGVGVSAGGEAHTVSRGKELKKSL